MKKDLLDDILESEDVSDTQDIPVDYSDTQDMSGDYEDTKDMPADYADTSDMPGAITAAQSIPDGMTFTQDIPGDFSDTKEISGERTDPVKMSGNRTDTLEIQHCPECGEKIPKGMMYCPVCGGEIRFVPEFEPEVDDSIAVAMNGVASEIASHTEEEKPKKRFFIRREDGAGDAFFDFHIRLPKKAVRYLAIGVAAAAFVAVAVSTIPNILRLEVFERGTRASEQPQSSVPIQEQVPGPSADGAGDAEQVHEDIPDAPSLEPESGRYEGEVTVALANMQKGMRYFYTLDNSTPSEKSQRYLGSILLSEEGETRVRMVAVDESGRLSEETLGVYVLDAARPEPPVILEDSGEYTQSTMIVAVPQQDCTITYTTDGSDPTEESAVYTAPIKMPMGNSEFRFCAFDEEGNSSEIVDRSYHLVYARLVSEEQAVASVLRVLVDKSLLVDQTGQVFGGGYNTYRVESTIEIEGAGEYYRILETYTNTEGSSADTGLLYAVNTNDGSVYRLGYDSSGRYTLLTLAGR